MKICPKCNKVMEDEAKFCSECAGELLPIAEEATAPQAAEEIKEEAEKECEKAAEQPSAKKSSLMGKFVCMLLAVVAVALMYVFYGELGFETNTKKSAETVVFYEKDGQICCTDLTGAQYVITNDYPVGIENSIYRQSAITGELTFQSRLQASADGKTVFFPDKTYDAEKESYSLYCVKTGDDSSRSKIANRVVSYRIVEDGSAVYYLDHDQNLYRSDLKASAVIERNVTDFLVFDGEEKVVYLVGGDLFTVDQEGKKAKIASSVDEMRANETEKRVYYRKGTELYCDDFKECTLLAEDVSCLLANAGDYLVYQDTKGSIFLAKDRSVSTTDCPRRAEQFRFAWDFSALYYAQRSESENKDGGAYDRLPLLDVYCIALEDGKAGQSQKVAFDAVMYDPCAWGVVNYQVAGDCIDLYVNGTMLAGDVLTAVGHGDVLAFGADCDDSGNGTLKIYDGKKTVTVAQDVTMFGYTEKGELVYLANVARADGKGQLYQYTKDGPKLVAEDVSGFVIAN